MSNLLDTSERYFYKEYKEKLHQNMSTPYPKVLKYHICTCWVLFPECVTPDIPFSIPGHI